MILRLSGGHAAVIGMWLLFSTFHGAQTELAQFGPEARGQNEWLCLVLWKLITGPRFLAIDERGFCWDAVSELAVAWDHIMRFRNKLGS